MRKKRAIRNFAGIIFLCLVVLIFTIISFPIPDSDYTFVGFARGIDKNVEYTGGSVLTYNVYSDSSLNGSVSEGLNATTIRLEKLLSDKGYSTNVYKTSNSSIKIEALFNGFDDNFENVENIINLDNSLKFKIKNDETVYLNGYDIKNVTAFNNRETVTSDNNWGVLIEFTNDGQSKFTELTEKLAENSGTVEIYIGVDTNPVSSFSISEKYENKSIFISGGTMTNENEAKSMAEQMNSTKYKYSFKQESKVIISKDRANINLILTAIIYVITLIMIVTFLYVRFKKLGLLSGGLAVLIAALAQILLMMSIPNIVLTTTSFMACILTMLMGGTITSILFEKMRKEYAIGKKIHASVKSGFSKIFVYVLDFLALTSISFFVLLITGTEMIKQFAGAFLIGTLVYGLSSLLLSYLFAKFYVDINPTNSKKYGFKREGHINELN